MREVDRQGRGVSDARGVTTLTHGAPLEAGNGRSPVQSLFHPRSIAVVGASDDPSRIGGRSISYLRQAYQGTVYPIHPTRDRIQGIEAFPDLLALPEPPELVTVAVAAALVPALAEQAAAAGAGALVVFSAGFAESDDAGAGLQAQLVEISRSSGMRICGPNCIGLVGVADGVYATFASFGDLEFSAGPIALVSQSGAFGIHLFKAAQSEGLRVGYFCSTGNEADLNSTQLLAHLVEEPQVDVLMAVMESIKDTDLLIEVAERSHQLDKPLLLMKMGTSEVGARAALSHTSSVSGPDTLIGSLLEHHGVLRPKTMHEMINWALAFRTQRRPKGDRVGIVTLSGGAGILMADAAPAAGLTLPVVPANQQSHLASIIPAFGETSNPIDCTGQVVNDFAMFTEVLRTVVECEEFDTVVLAGLPDEVKDNWLEAVDLVAGINDKPVFVWCGGGAWFDVLRERSIPAFSDPADVMEAIGALTRFATYRSSDGKNRMINAHRQREARRMLQEVRSPSGIVPGPVASSVLSMYGIAVPIAAAVDNETVAIQAAEKMGYPVALKLMSHDMPHKSEHGGVVLGIADEWQLRAAIQDLFKLVQDSNPAEATHQIMVQKMVSGTIEVVCGMRARFGIWPVYLSRNGRHARRGHFRGLSVTRALGSRSSDGHDRSTLWWAVGHQSARFDGQTAK